MKEKKLNPNWDIVRSQLGHRTKGSGERTSDRRCYEEL